jgi:hypothetical protein
MVKQLEVVKTFRLTSSNLREKTFRLIHPKSISTLLVAVMIGSDTLVAPERSPCFLTCG